MKKRCCYVLSLAILLCSCSQAGIPQTPDFSQNPMGYECGGGHGGMERHP